ncbi:MAG: amidohydrolase, partial [Ruminococcaceae bacterium]|nr:amidohydrolase [Oscillospiraceae bacterium]
KNLWFDTSMGVLEGLSKEKARRIILRHDPEKVLFGTDFPWCDPKMNVDFIRSLGLPDALNEMIFHGNAETLLSCI